MDTNRHSSEYLTLSDAAHQLGVHYETAARWVRSGKLQGRKVSRKKVLVSRESCETLRREGEPSEAGAPHRWLRLVGTLTDREADELLERAKDFEVVDEED